MQERLLRLAANDRTPVLLLALASLIAVPLILHFQRDAGIWFDAWHFLLYRESWAPSNLLEPFNGHLMPVTTIAFNLDSALFHPGAAGFLTACSIAAQLAVVWAAFQYLRKRVGEWLAAAFCLLLLVFGSGAEVLAWNFNIGWLVSLAAGIAAVNVFEREDSSSNRVLASALLLLSICGNNNGVAFIAAILLCAVFRDTRRRALLVSGPPLVLWVIWYFASGGGGRSLLPKTWPAWDAQVIEATFSGLIGVFDGVNAWGAPLAVLTIGGMLWLLSRREELDSKLLCAFAVPLGFLALLTASRGGFYDAAASRYQYTMLLLIALPLGELLRGYRLKRAGGWIGLVAVLGFFIAGNLVAMADGAAFFRRGFESNRVYMTALLEVGPQAAASTTYDNLDPAVRPYMNKDVYEWLVNRGGKANAWSREQLAAQPESTHLAVRETVDQLRRAVPAADSSLK